MKEQYTYCIRCGKGLNFHEAYYSKDDPDHEEAMCHNCYQRLRLTKSPKIEKKVGK